MFVLIETNIENKDDSSRFNMKMTLFKYHARKFDSFVIQRSKKGENKSHFPIHWTNIYL